MPNNICTIIEKYNGKSINQFFLNQYLADTSMHGQATTPKTLLEHYQSTNWKVGQACEQVFMFQQPTLYLSQ